MRLLHRIDFRLRKGRDLEVAEVNTSIVEIAKRTALALVAGLLVGFVLGQYITPMTSQRLLIGIVLSAITYRTQSIVAMGLVPLAAIAASSALLQIIGLLFTYRIDFVWLAVIVALIGLMIVLRWQRSVEKKLEVIDVLFVLLVAVILQFLTRQSTWDVREALAAVSVTGEDNGSWLDGVSGILNRDAAFDSQGIALGGHIATILSSLLVGTAHIFGFLSGATADSAVMTMQMYWVLAAFAVLLAARLTYLLGEPHVGRPAVGLSALSAIMTAIFSQGFISGGHLTAMLAATFLLASLLMLLEKPFTESVTSILALLLLLGAADAWTPTRGVLVLVLVAALSVSIVKVWNARTQLLTTLGGASATSIVRSKSSLGIAIVVGVLGLIFGRYMFGLEGRSLSDYPEMIRTLLIVDGGKADVHPLVAITVSLFAIVAASNTSLVKSSRWLFTALLGSCIIFPALLIAYGFTQPPYSPQYAAYKVLYMICLVVTPVSIAGLAITVRRLSQSDALAVIAIVVVVIMGSTTFLEPYPRLKNLLVAPPTEFWVDAAMMELTMHPDRRLICLDTREQWQGQDARDCSRQLAGIQGMTNSSPLVWLEANICRASSAEIAALPEEFWQNVTILVTDSQRLVSTDECDRFGWAGQGLPDDERYPIGVLSGVPWKTVRVIGPDGEEVRKSFAYLSGKVPDEVLVQLEQGVAG